MSSYTEIDAIKAVDEALGKLNPDERERVLLWASAKFAFERPPIHEGKSPVVEPAGLTGRRKIGKRPKSVLKMVKDLDLHPKGKPSAVDFANDKSPANVKQKSVVAVHYLREVSGVKQVSVDHVYTYFKAVGWPVPSDVPNTLQQAGTQGWLDSRDSQNILLTTSGENLIEHQLPVKAGGRK